MCGACFMRVGRLWFELCLGVLQVFSNIPVANMFPADSSLVCVSASWLWSPWLSNMGSWISNTK